MQNIMKFQEDNIYLKSYSNELKIFETKVFLSTKIFFLLGRRYLVSGKLISLDF